MSAVTEADVTAVEQGIAAINLAVRQIQGGGGICTDVTAAVLGAGGGMVGNTVTDGAVVNVGGTCADIDIAALALSRTTDHSGVFHGQGCTGGNRNITAIGTGSAADDLTAQNFSGCIRAGNAYTAAVAVGNTLQQNTAMHYKSTAAGGIHQTACAGSGATGGQGDGTAEQFKLGAGGFIVDDLDNTASLVVLALCSSAATAYGIQNAQITVDGEQTGSGLGGDGVATQVQHGGLTGNNIEFLHHIVAGQIVVTAAGLCRPGLPGDVCKFLPAAAAADGGVRIGNCHRNFCRSMYRQYRDTQKQRCHQQQREKTLFHVVYFLSLYIQIIWVKTQPPQR